ncbi:hypothetical protein RSOL_362600, partial [Rhizoctonia solani AG-3 Rhs1AP]
MGSNEPVEATTPPVPQPSSPPYTRDDAPTDGPPTPEPESHAGLPDFVSRMAPRSVATGESNLRLGVKHADYEY